MITDDEIYQIVSDELKNNQIDDGLKLRSLVESEGDEKRGLAIYSKHRFRQVKQFYLDVETHRKNLQEEEYNRIYNNSNNNELYLNPIILAVIIIITGFIVVVNPLIALTFFVFSVSLGLYYSKNK